jgi:monoamine oxidase
VVVNAGSECEQLADGGFAERPIMRTLTAARVVLAVPPALVRQIRVDLPPAARAFVDGANTGGVVKIFVAYERPFWRDAGWSGEAYRPAPVAMSSSAEQDGGGRIPDSGSPNSAPRRTAVRAVIANGNALVAFVVGREAARWASRGADERRSEVIDTLVEEFGEGARDVIDYVEADWAADPWSAGCVVSTPVGVLARIGELGGRGGSGAAWGGAAWGEAFGRVHVAGTEAARVWTGYMDGAIEAGERAASEVLAASS